MVMKERMAAVRKVTPDKGLAFTEAERPAPRGREVLVEVTACSLCGTDIHLYNWDPPWSARGIALPRTLGHEVAGVVVEAGAGVTSLQPGDVISAESHLYCGSCRQCRAGNAHICEKLRFLGVDTDGGFAEYVVIPESVAWKNPEGMKPEIATLQESMGNSVYTVEEAEVTGKIVAIFGLGPTGLFATGIAKASGAEQVIAIGGTKIHMDIAKQMGADVLVNRHEADAEAALRDLTGGLGVDVSLEMSGNAAALRQALAATKPTGKVMALGLPTADVSLDVSKQIVLKDLELRGIYGRRIWETWEKTSELLHAKKLDITPVITHRLRLEDFEAGIRAMQSGSCGKVVMFPK
jgi:threonine 3-dehydrogenase